MTAFHHEAYQLKGFRKVFNEVVQVCCNKRLSRKEVFCFFQVVTLVYVFPIVHADYLYIDDQWRALGYGGWWEQGRFLIEVFFGGLTFSGAIPNIFPLPLFISTVAISLAMTRLAMNYFNRCTYMACLVILPLWCNPFFLGNLTYQYDGPAMVLGMVAIIYSMTLRLERPVPGVLLSSLLICVAMSFFQLLVSLFVGLCCVEVVRDMRACATTKIVYINILRRMAQLVLGVAIYYFLVLHYATTQRGALLDIDVESLKVVGERLILAIDKVGLLHRPAIDSIALFMGVFAAYGGGRIISKSVGVQSGKVAKIGLLFVGCLLPVVLVISIPGGMLILFESRMDARNLIGFSSVIITFFYLFYFWCEREGSFVRVVLVLPFVYAFSLSYAYGQVLVAKKDLEVFLATSLAYDLTARESLKDVKVFAFDADSPDSNWIPAAQASMELMPVLRYILSDDNTILFPDKMVRAGLTNVAFARDEKRRSILASKDNKLVVDSRFYQIYLNGNSGLIRMKPTPGSVGR